MDIEQEMDTEKKFWQTGKPGLIAVGVLLFIGLGVYQLLFKVSDEIGFLGAGKVGRQVFIQTYDNYLQPAVRVDSDFFDHSFIERLIVGEPRRTTLKLDIQETTVLAPRIEAAQAFLNLPHAEITDLYKGAITMQDDFELSPEELRQSLKEKEVVTVQDFLAGMGFHTLELYEKRKRVGTIAIQGTKNVKHVGGY